MPMQTTGRRILTDVCREFIEHVRRVEDGTSLLSFQLTTAGKLPQLKKMTLLSYDVVHNLGSVWATEHGGGGGQRYKLNPQRTKAHTPTRYHSQNGSIFLRAQAHFVDPLSRRCSRKTRVGLSSHLLCLYA